ncbi:MAG: hypothetical protein QM652_11350 [Legionella sp.]|uniref:capsular polysaccharide export protein, LipB/KpsS family n=1 Tax=Legionella sp. TaxID=459 RepID=UPI0039E2E708
MQIKSTSKKVSTFKNFFKKITKIAFKRKNTTIFLVGFSPWKRCFKKYFSECNLIFIPKNISELEFGNKYIKKILIHKLKCQIFIWGYKSPAFIRDFIAKENIPTKYVEDGFIRSVQLGSSKTPPLSLCLDSKAPYFDASRPSELEELLNHYDFDKNPDLIREAKLGIQLLCDLGISKYNHTSPVSIAQLYGQKKGKRVLVLGQVEDDASITYGCKKRLTNNDLVRLAVNENPEAQVIYKPHPDVLNGNRPCLSNPNEVSDICMVLTQDIPLANALETIDHVYTITSLSGFEALLRGIKVTTLGSPFYAGWGLTDDRQKNERRVRKLKLEQLFAIAYLVYPKYFDFATGRQILFFNIVNILRKNNLDTSSQL